MVDIVVWNQFRRYSQHRHWGGKSACRQFAIVESEVPTRGDRGNSFFTVFCFFAQESLENTPNKFRCNCGPLTVLLPCDIQLTFEMHLTIVMFHDFFILKVYDVSSLCSKEYRVVSAPPCVTSPFLFYQCFCRV